MAIDHLAAQVRLVQRAAGLQLHVQAAVHLLDRAGRAQERLQQLQVEVPGQVARDRLAVQPPGDDQIAAVGLEVRLVEHDALAVDADVQRARRLDPHALDGRLAVRALDGARHRQPQLGQQEVQRQRARRIDVGADAPADDAARVAELDQLGRERLDLDAPEVDLGVNDRAPWGASAACASTSKRSNSRP